MQAAPRVAKPESNYGSEFDHMSNGGWENNGGINLMSGPTIRIPADAQATHDLNEELFGQENDTELSYSGALENNHIPALPDVDEVESIAQERASTVYRTPAVQKSASRFSFSWLKLFSLTNSFRRYFRLPNHHSVLGKSSTRPALGGIRDLCP